MATTKAYELGQLAKDLSVDSSGNITINADLDVDYAGFDSDFSSKSTTDLSEGNNLYHTNTRVDTRINLQTGSNLDLSSKSTADLSEGSNLYYTDARADARIAAADTGDLSEGSNLYYTDARARGAVSLGTAGSQAYNSSTGAFTIPGTTDHITEGTNLFFTNARADARINLQTGSNLDLSSKSTSDLSEGSNLYYTNARADARIAAADTGDLSEGSNLYYTDARADARIAAADTGDLSEGSNLYYTDARADARIAAASTTDLSEGSNLYYTTARGDSDTGAYISGNRTYGNITTTGYIAGPATMTIDPAAVGDNTGTLVIAGDLQVDGTTTTINSTTLTVDDKNITLASGAANNGAANGAGITVDGSNATITYDGTNDEWDFNKDINVSGDIGVTGTVTADGLTVSQETPKITITDTGTGADHELNGASSIGNLTLNFDKNDEGASPYFYIQHAGNKLAAFRKGGDISFYEDTGTTAKFFWDASAERLGIGTTTVNADLHLGAASPHIDIGPSAGNRGKVGFDSNNVYIGSTSGTGEIHFKNNIGSTDAPHSSGDTKMVITDSGVGIGDSTPTEGKLVVRGDANTNGLFVGGNSTTGQSYGALINAGTNSSDANFRLYDQSGSTPYLFVRGDGNVGIGTSQPDLTLHVDGTNGYPASSGSTPVGHIAIRAKNESSSHGAHIGVANASPWGTWIQAQDAGNLATNYPLLLNPNGGNVGIGTSNPGAKLEILSDGSDDDGAEILLKHANNNTSDIISTIKFANNTGSAAMIQAGTTGANNSGYIDFFTDNAGSSSRVARMTPNGRVGIGIVAPDAPLHIEDNTSSAYGGIRVVGAGTGSGSTNVRQIADFGRTSSGSDSGVWLGGRTDETTAVIGAKTASGNIAFEVYQSGWQERMRIKNNGNVGIGTTSPSTELHIEKNSANPTLRLQRTSYAYTDLIGSTGATGNDFKINLNGNDRFYIQNSSGNVGIGRTPQSHYTGFVALDLGYSASLFANDTGSDTNVTVLANNTYLNSTGSAWKYIVTDEATKYEQSNGKHRWFHASSGSAGTDITWTNSMSIDTAGNVGIGETNPSYSLDMGVGKTIRLRHTANGSAIRVGASDYDVNLIRFDGSTGITDNGYYGGALRYMGSRAGDANSLSIFMDNALGTEVEAMTIRQSGNVGIGTDNPSTKLHVNGNIRASTLYQEGGDSASSAMVVSQGVNTTRASVALWAKDHGSYPGQVHIVSHSANASADSGKIMFWDYNGSAWNANGAWDKDGNLGVGTTSPGAKLDVRGSIVQYLDNGGISFNKTSSVSSTNKDYYGAILRVDSNGYHYTSTQGGFGSAANDLAFMHHGNLAFATTSATGDNSTNYPTGRMIILENGNVGIGTRSPTGIFQVGSDIGGNFIVGNDATSTNNRHSNTDHIATFQRDSNAFVQIASGNNASNTGIKFMGAGDRGSVYGTSGYDIHIEPNCAYGNGDVIIKGKNDSTHQTRVGIGTTTPEQNLHIKRASGSDTGGQGHILLDVADDGGPAYALRIGDTADDGDFHIDRRFSGTWYDTFAIDRSTGDVKVTNSAPTGNTKLIVHNNSASNAAAVLLRGERTSTSADVGQLIFDNSGKTIANVRGATDGSTSNGALEFWTAATSSNAVKRWYISSGGDLYPGSNDAYDIGSTTAVVRNIYTGDLHLSNEGKTEGNRVDGTKGNWTIQEGEEDLFIINNKSGKKYKFSLEEIG